MNEELKNKIYNYQVNPPGKIWPAIASALNEDIDAAFPAKLYSFETTPPPGIWNKISQDLDINVNATFPQKLFVFEATPPAGLWNKIADELHDENDTKVIPVFKKTIPIWKYAAAAAVIGLIAFSLLWMNNNSEAIGDEIVSTTPENVVPAERNNPTAPSVNSPSTSEPTELRTEENISKDKKWVAKNSYREKYPNQRIYAAASIDELRNAPAQLSPTFSVDIMAENLQPRELSARQIAYNPSRVAENNPYVTVISPDGYVIRISKKLAGMIGCLNNEPTLNDVDCKAKVQKWREQIAQSPITPAPGNFLDMLDLINSIKENTP